MAYTSTIATLRGELIHIVIDGDDVGESELTLAGEEPIVIEYESDDIFKPLKMSGCTVKVVTDSNLFDLFTGQLTAITLKVYRNLPDEDGEWTDDDAELIWFGYLSPNVYSTSYNDPYEELALEFVDVISVLENLKFTKEGFWKSFKQYMLDAISAAGASDVVTDIIVPDDYHIDITEVGCMERNFIDETDDDESGAESYKDVLEDIMQYLGLSMIYRGNALYLIDPLNSGETAHDISYYGVAGSDAQISLGNIYNKVTVVENTNPMEDIVDTALIDEDNMQSFMDTDDPYYVESLAFYRVSKTFSDVSYKDCYGIYIPKNNWVMKNGTFASGASEITNDATHIVSYCTDNSSRVRLADYSVFESHYKKADDGTITYEKRIDAGAFILFDTSYENNQAPSRLTFSKKCVFYINSQYVTYAENDHYCDNTTDTVFLSYQSPEGSVTALKGGYLILALTWKYTRILGTDLDIKNIAADSNMTVQDFIDTSLRSLTLDDTWKIKLRIGTKYFNGETWTTEESTFNVGHTWDATDNLIDNEVSLNNSATYEMALKDSTEGCAIPIDGDLFGDVQLDIYAPSFFAKEGLKDSVDVKTNALEISNLELKYTVSEDLGNIILDSDDNEDNDITICNVIDDANVQELSDIELKVNTYSTEQTSYSYAIQYDGDYAYYNPTKSQEHRLIDKYVNYYKTPRMEFTNTLKDDYGKHILPWSNINISFLSKNLVVDAVTYDLAMNTANVTLKEILS